MGENREDLKPLPELKSDEEAERFVAEADLSEYDLSQFKPVHFEFQPKNKQVNMRLPAELLNAIKKGAEQRGVPYQRYMRDLLERGIRQDRPKG
jgi:predicted DNA binding CopG/RHH family protein